MRIMQGIGVFIIAASFLLSGCNTLLKPKNHVGYRAPSNAQALDASEPQEGKEKANTLTVAIVPLFEKRGDLKSYGSVYSYLIPLVPYGTMRYERPDQARMFNTQDEVEFNMSENLIRIVVDRVKKSGLFSDVVLTPTPLEAKPDLILSGDIFSTLYEGKTYSYGVSFLGPALWCLGLPAGSSHKKLQIALYLKKSDSSELVWSYTINKEKTVIQGLYHNWGKNMNSFVGLMEEGAREAMEDMRLKLSGISLDTLKAKSLEPSEPPVVNPQPELPEAADISGAAANSTIAVSSNP